MQLFDKLPTPVLALAAMGSVLLMGLDLLIIDPLPFIDEALLLFMTAGSTTELLSRFRSTPRLAAGGEATPRLSRLELRNREAALKSLPVRTTALLARARLLESQGHSAVLFEGLESLPEQVAQMRREGAEHSAYFTRKENDLWQIRRQVEHLARAIGRLQMGRPTPKLEQLRAELIGLQEHELKTLARLKASDDLRERLFALSEQVDALADDLANLADDGLVQGGWKTALLPDLDPRIAGVVRGLEQLAVAEAEIEHVLTGPARSTAFVGA